VLEDGRQVAVKRMLKAYHASADREISLLIESDGHPNVVRYFLKEVRGEFVYLALELCDLSLHDLIAMLRHRRDMPDKENDMPSAIAESTKAVLFQVANGVKHLHLLRIVHRDLKPANILLATARKKNDENVYNIFIRGDYVAKISDMGLGKQLPAGSQSSYGASLIGESSLRGQSNGAQSSIVGPGPGSVGWQAPEVMALRVSSETSVRSDDSSYAHDSLQDMSPMENPCTSRTSRSTDIFSLGCIFFATLVPGSHPFGEWYEREANIVHNRPNIDVLRALSAEAYDLVGSMIRRNPINRPLAKHVCDHPFFWSLDRRLTFLSDFSDKLETDATIGDGESRVIISTLAIAAERNASHVVGLSWDTLLDSELVSNVQKFRTYDPSSVRDLLRLIRNKHHHFDELPEKLKAEMRYTTGGLMTYFESRFPLLLIHCFNICRTRLPAKDILATKYSISPVVRPGMKRLELQVSTITEGSAIAEPSVVSKADSVFSTDLGILASDDAHELKLFSHDDSPSIEPVIVDEITLVEKDHQDTSIALASEFVVNEQVLPLVDAGDIVVWEGSNAAKTFHCRGWSRSDSEWERRIDASLRKRDNNLVRCSTDPKFRTRLCNHWQETMGTSCPMLKRNKCIFAHGPVELRVKEGKLHRWGRLVDKNGDNKTKGHSGGEDTYGAARLIESERKEQGKWNVEGKAPQKGKNNKKTLPKKGGKLKPES
jgi:serine/threonine protein kinase